MNKVSKFFSSDFFIQIAKSSLEVSGSENYEKVVNILWECYKNKGTVFTMGCGGSASTATHFASDLAKTTIVEGKPRFKSFALVDNIPLVSAWTNDSGWHSIFSEQLEPWITKKDVLVGFSVHGGSVGKNKNPWSQNLTSAMKLAQERGAKIVGFSGFDGGAMKEMADACITINNSSEIYGTPVVEAMHVTLHHCIIFDLKQRIKDGK